MKYSLVGIDGNAYSVMAYVSKALKDTNHKDLVDAYKKDAMSSDYDHLLCVSMNYLDIANGEKKNNNGNKEAKVELKSESVDWGYYDCKQELNSKYLPNRGEGDNMATQAITALNKLIYKWYNDGDVYDNRYLGGWANDLSDYANWLYTYVVDEKMRDIMFAMISQNDTNIYEYGLKLIHDYLMDEELLAKLEKSPKVGSVYDCDGPFYFEEYREDEEQEEDEWYDEDEEEDY